MQATGLTIVLIDCEPEVAEEFNRWYDLDHLPENAALPGHLGARRYVATPSDKELRRSVGLEELARGRGSFCTTYWLCADDLPEARSQMASLARRLAKEGRMFPRAQARYVESYRLARSYVRPGLPLSPEAAFHVGHRGIFVVIEEMLDRARWPEVEHFYEQGYIPDVLDLRGFAAALRLDSVDPQHPGRFLHIFFLDEDPSRPVYDLREGEGQWRQRGGIRRPAGASQVLFSGPFHLIAPLQYDFIEKAKG